MTRAAERDCHRHLVAIVHWRRSGSSSRHAVGHHRTFGSWRENRWRIVGIFEHGWSLIIAASLLNHQLLPVKPGRPEAWPRSPEVNEAFLAPAGI